MGAGHLVEPQQDCDAHEVVGDGHPHRRHEAAPRVEQCGGESDEPVEGDLGHEPPEQRSGDVLLAPQVRGSQHPFRMVERREGVDDERCADEEEDRGADEDHRRDRHDGRDRAPCLLVRARGEAVDEHRDEGRREHAAEDDVVEHVRGRVGQVVAVGKAEEAEHVSEREDPQYTGEARHGGTAGHPERGALEDGRGAPVLGARGEHRLLGAAHHLAHGVAARLTRRAGPWSGAPRGCATRSGPTRPRGPRQRVRSARCRRKRWPSSEPSARPWPARGHLGGS